MKRICFSILVPVLFLPAFIHYAEDIPTSPKKLLGHWSFDTDAVEKVKDSSGNGNDGYVVLNGKKLELVPGHSGKAIRFESNGKKAPSVCIVIPGLGACNFENGMTVEAWIKLDENISPKARYDIVNNMPCNYGPGFRCSILCDRLQFNSGSGKESRKTWGAITNKITHPLPRGTWCHIAWVWDGKTFRIYLDGKEVVVNDAGMKITKGRKDICIGAFLKGRCCGFKGLIDEVKIYNYPLSSVEILKHAKFE